MKYIQSLPGLVIIFLLFSCDTGKISIDATNHIFQDTTTFRNPVIKGFYPDPSICRVDSNYYLVTSSFEYFPGVPVFHSTDLVNWKQIGNVLTRKSQLNLDSTRSSGGIFAPAIRYHNGWFYMITTNVSRGLNFFVKSKDPAGPWSDPIFINVKCIDPSLFFDEDGKVYFTGNTPWGVEKDGIYQAEMDMENGNFLTPYKLIWTGTGERYPEGPHLYKINNIYYLMIAEGGTEAGHMETIARSDNPWGPFEACPHNPILSNRNLGGYIVQNTGHADIIQAPDGKWWMVHLAVRSVNQYHHLGRETFLAAVEWNDEGWPVINRDGTSPVEMHAVPPAPKKQDDYYGTYDFEETELGFEWNYLRNPDTTKYSLTENPGSLSLTTSGASLDDLLSPTFIGIRQKDFDMEVTSILHFNPLKENEEAGIVALMNENHYYTVSVIRKNGRRYTRCILKVGNIKHVAGEKEIKGKETHLKISATKHMYKLFWSPDGKNWELLGENQAKYLSSEVAGGFTGTYLGMFATANGGNGGSKAYFERFGYHAE